jgi:hypothetical protein
MRTQASPLRARQLKLFHPPSMSPRWEDLPREIRQQIVRLLAQLLREPVRRDSAPGQAKGVSDE